MVVDGRAYTHEGGGPKAGTSPDRYRSLRLAVAFGEPAEHGVGVCLPAECSGVATHVNVVEDPTRVELPASETAGFDALTTLGPGARVTVTLAERSDGGPPLSTATTVEPTVDDRYPRAIRNGTVLSSLGAEFDTTGLTPGTSYELVVRAGGSVVHRRPGVVAAPSPTATPTRDTPTPAPPATTTPLGATAGPMTPPPTEPAPRAATPGLGAGAALVVVVALVLWGRRQRR